MADDQVKYSDLIADDVVKGLELLNKALQDIKTTMAGVKEEAASLGVSLKNVSTATREQQQATAQNAASAERLSKRMKDLNDEERKVEEIKRRYKKLTDEQIQAVNAFQQALRGSTAQQLAALNAIDVETKSYNELNAMYNALKDSLNAMTVAERQNTEAGKAMTVQSAKIYDTMNELQKATGKYTLQVGKYRAAFDGLGYSFQQILREAPSALNLNQFFLAISNNIPMFLDQMKAFKNEQAEIKANLATMTKGTAEYAEQMGKVMTVGQKLAKTLFSWQSLVLVVLLLLRKIPDLIKKIRKTGDEVLEFEQKAAEGASNLVKEYQDLVKEWNQLGDSQNKRAKWIDEHKKRFDELGLSIKNVNDADRAFSGEGTLAYIRAVKQRAIADAYKDKLAKSAINADNLAEQINRSGTHMVVNGRVVKTVTEYMHNKTTDKLLSDYQTAMNEQLEIEKKIVQLENEASKTLKYTRGNGSGNNKEPKDQVDDLLALERALIDERIANIEDEYKRLDAEENERYRRFLEDREAELKLLAEDDPRRAVINKRIEEEEQTHIRKMFEIDEKRRQDLIKLSDEEKKIKEKKEKNNAKAELKAMADGWQKQRAELVKEGATRREIVEAEVAAEISRLNLMLQLNRDVNGEKMSDEQKAKVQEWINLLEKLQQTGNYGDYKPGQFIGKGGANVTNERKYYANIWEVLDIDMDNNQVSALNSVFDQAKAALNSWMDARKAAADQAKELADDEVSAAENALNREIELRNQGYANDVALREKELADAKAQQKKALEMQQKAKEEELAINTAMEASNMAVAIANLFKQFGLWSIPMIGVMLGAWGAAKASAFSQIKSTKYREGGYMLLEGGSHQSGHDVNLGVGPDGSNLRAEGGEYFAVINKRNSRKYSGEIPGIVNALNSGMFEDRYIKTSDAVGLLPRVIRADNGSTVDLSAVESGVGQLVKQGERSWSTEGEYRVMRYKNLTRRVRVS